MILVIRPIKVFRDQSCQTTPWKSYCPCEVKKCNFFTVFSNILKTMIDRMILSIAELILMKDLWKFAGIKLVDSLLELLFLKGKKLCFSSFQPMS